MDEDIVFRRDNSDVVYEDNDDDEQEMFQDDEWDIELKALLTPDPIEDEEADLHYILYPPKNPWDAPEDDGDEDEFPWGNTSINRIETIKLLLSKPLNSLMQEDKDTVISFIRRFN